jgi:hypothetical protein
MPTIHAATKGPRAIRNQARTLRRLHALAWPIAVLIAGCASLTPPVAEAPVPAQLDPGPGHRVVTTLHARGVQVYECREAKDAAGRFAWAFIAPEAELFDAAQRPSGLHGAGPSWQAPDGSRIVGTVRQRADATEPGAIPQLLLATRSEGPGGRFSNVVAVQRLNTHGGAAPATACAQANASQTVRVPYTADYRMFAQWVRDDRY